MTRDMHGGALDARRTNAVEKPAADVSAAAAGDAGVSAPAVETLMEDFEELKARLGTTSLLPKGVEVPSGAVESVATWGDGTMDGLVADMDSKERKLSAGFLEKPVQAWFLKYGLTPILETRQSGPILIGLRACKGDGHELRHPAEILERMGEFNQWILPRLQCLEGKWHRIVYLLLNHSDFDSLSKLAADENLRRDYLKKVNPELSATIAYYTLLRRAIHLRASDVHIEPYDESNYRVRYRIDGVLQPEDFTLSKERGTHLVGKIKVESTLKTQEKRLPQDGGVAFSEAILKEFPFLTGYSLRVATNPTPLGEKVSIRLLKAAKETGYDLDKLGLPANVHRKLEAQIETPEGVILVSGPTGSGKTTTLYSILRRLNKPAVNIQTIEDPVEVLIPGLNQSQVNRDIDYDFARALRSFLRLDPDIILVGEVRDAETAKIMVEAAGTGHLVFSTIHTNDAISVLARLYELGVERTRIQSTLRCVVAQRLVRTLCPCLECREPYDARPELNKLFEEDVFRLREGSRAVEEGDSSEALSNSEAVVFFRPVSKGGYFACKTCHGTGYFGRAIVPELWVIGREERDLIVNSEYSYARYHDLALSKGMLPMAYVGLELALQGRVTLQELKDNVIIPEEWVERRREMADFIQKAKARYPLKILAAANED